MLTYKWRLQGQEVISSWNVGSPFAILRTDLWIPGLFTNRNVNVILMNIICDITQFVIVVPVSNISAANLAEYFMQPVLLIFGIYHLVILNDGSPFKCIFTAICKDLNINYDMLAKL